MAAVAAISLVAVEWIGSSRARDAVNHIESNEARNVLPVVQSLSPYRRWADPILRTLIDDARTDARTRVRARLALLPVNPSQADELRGPLLDAGPEELIQIRRALYEYRDRPRLVGFFSARVRDERESLDHRLRAAITLAGLLGAPQAAEDRALREAAVPVAGRLVEELLTHPDRFHDWLMAMQPARAVLISPLEAIFRDAGRGEAARSMSATILVNFARDDPETLTGLLLDANIRQFQVMIQAVAAHRTSVSTRLRALIAEEPRPGSTREERFAFVGRQANAAIALLYCGDPESLWPLLRHSEDPLLRTYLIDRLPRLVPDPASLLHRLEAERDVSSRRTRFHPGWHPRRPAIPLLGGVGEGLVARSLRERSRPGDALSRRMGASPLGIRESARGCLEAARRASGTRRVFVVPDQNRAHDGENPGARVVSHGRRRWRRGAR